MFLTARRVARLMAPVVLTAVSQIVVDANPAVAGPAPAQVPPGDTPWSDQGTTEHSGTATETGYEAAAAYVAANGSGSRSTRRACAWEHMLTEEWHHLPAHVEVHSVPMGGPTDAYFVYVLCVADGMEVPGWFFDRAVVAATSGPGFEIREVSFAIPVPPEDLVEQALALLEAPQPVITTSPESPSMVGIDTWLMVDPDSWDDEDNNSITLSSGALSVTVTATPVGGASIVWDTGDGNEVPCATSGDQGSCRHEYQRSSFGQSNTDAQGRPAYAITASTTFTGSYQVYAFGEPVGGDSDIGEVTRTSAPLYLGVQEAQAINTED